MRRLLFFSFLLLASSATLMAEINLIRVPRGYFFPPSRGLYYFRPDLYVQQQIAPFYRYGYYTRPRPYFYPWTHTPSVNPCSFAGLCGRGRVFRLFVNSPSSGELVRVNSSDIVFNVRPARSLIWVDGQLVGSARDFATEKDRFPILDGEHNLRIESPGFKAFETLMKIVPNRTLHLEIELQPDG